MMQWLDGWARQSKCKVNSKQCWELSGVLVIFAVVQSIHLTSSAIKMTNWFTALLSRHWRCQYGNFPLTSFHSTFPRHPEEIKSNKIFPENHCKNANTIEETRAFQSVVHCDDGNIMYVYFGSVRALKSVQICLNKWISFAIIFFCFWFHIGFYLKFNEIFEKKVGNAMTLSAEETRRFLCFLFN
jgi:hypothetical protein